MKRFLCVLMILLLLIPPMAVSAEGEPSFALTGVAAEGQTPVLEGKIGDTVQVQLSAQNLPDCSNMELIFLYDTAALKPTDHKKGDVAGLYFGNVEYSLKDTDGVGQPGDTSVKIAAITTSKTTPLVSGDGVLVTLTFEIIGTPADAKGAFVSLAKYSLSQMDEDLTKVTGIPQPTAYITVLQDEPVQPQMTGIEVTTLPTKTIYLEGKDVFDPAGGKITVFYDNGTTAEMNLSDAVISGFDNTAVGPQELTATYQGFTAKFSVTIKAKSMTGMEVTTLPTKTIYLEGKDVFDPAGGKITVFYDNNTTAEIALADADISGFNNTVVGPQELTATYQGFTAKFSVTIKAKSMTGIEVTTLPTKTIYLEGKDVFDPAGGKITVFYDNNTTAEIALSAATVTGFDNTVVGHQELTATYQGFTAKFSVTIKAKAMTGIEVTTLPTKTIYLEGKDVFDPAGGKITVFYDNGTTAEIALADADISGFNNTAVGHQELTATYQGFTAKFSVTIKAKSMTGIEVKTRPTKVEYIQGQALDLTNGVITVTYDNGDTEDISMSDPSVTISGYDNEAVGPQDLTVTYAGKTAQFRVQTIAKVVESIAVTTLPTKVEYIQGQALNPAGGKITATYNDKTTAEVSMTDVAVEVLGYNANTVGNQTITVTYAGKTAQFKVQTIAKVVESIAVTTLPTKVEYIQGQALNPAGGKITATYNDKTTVEINLTEPTVTVEGYDTAAVGTQSLTVTYAGKTAQFSVLVIAKAVESIAVTTLPAKVEYIQGQALNPAGGKITATYNDKTTAEVSMTDAAVEVLGYNANAVGNQTITVTYAGKTAQFKVDVIEKAVTAIVVRTNPTKLQYLEQKENLNLSGGVLLATFNDNDTVEISLTDPAVAVSGFDNTVVGPCELVVSYAGKTTTLTVTVIAKAVVRIELVAPTKRIYKMGEGLDFVGSTAIAYYDNGTSQPVSPASMTRSGFNNRVGGEQTVTLSYGGKSAAFTVLVLKNHPFTDIYNNDWYYINQSVPYVYTKGLMNGMTPTTFEAGGFTTRAQLVTILYRLEGQPSVSGTDGFTDVAPKDWYYNAVLWASKKGIVTGYPDGTFAPNKSISRAEMAVIFYRYTKDYKGQPASARANLNVFADRGEIAPWCADAISWAVAEGLMTGMTPTQFAPGGTATRAQIATVLMRYVERNRK